MKVLLQSIVIALLFFCGCTNEAPTTDWVRDGLVGKVKTIEEKVFRLLKDDASAIVEEDLYYTHSYFYDDVGNWLQTDSYDTYDELFNKHIVSYGEGGNRMESIQYTADGKASFKNSYTYDDSGNEVAKSVYNPDGSLFKKYVYAYDDRGQQIRTDSYNARGDLFDQFIYQYDDKGNRIVVIRNNTDAYENRKDIYANDNRGNPIEISSYLFNGQLASMERLKYEYDQKGNWIKKTAFDHQNEPIGVIKRVIEYF